MTPEQYQRVGQLYHQALEIERDQRSAFLERECSGDAVLRREVDSLIASHEEEETFLATPAVEVVAKQVADEGFLSSNQQVGHYRILSLLGKGGMGEVYLAQDTRLSRKVALKVLPAQFMQDAERVRRFEREARAASALNHPNILAIHEIGQTNIGHYIVTEFVEGETLRQRCARAKLTLLEALDISIQIAGALSAAHEAGVVHRDIKPENVMVRRDGYVKVLDFGLAKLMEKAPENLSQAETLKQSETTTTGVVMGTVAYMSPEQARGLKVDARTDIWSLVVLLYEMVAGRRPFAGGTTSDTLAAILDKEPPPLAQQVPDLPAELERVVAKGLEKEREYRYQTAGDLLSDLKRLKRQLESGTESARTVQLKFPDSGEGKARRQSLVLRSTALALLAVGIISGLYWWRPQKETPTKAVRLIPLTASPGHEMQPALSPDGDRVAFYWNGGQGENTDIYVQVRGTVTPAKLTATPANESSPVWSPDGRFIAFLRQSEAKNEVFVIPAIGGHERKVYEVGANPYVKHAIWPRLFGWVNDDLLAVVDKSSTEEPFSIFLLSLLSGKKQRLTSPPAGYDGDTNPTLSPDGQTLAFVRSRSFGGFASVTDIYVVPVSGGETRQLTPDSRPIAGLAWDADGRSIVFSSNRLGTFSLWRISASGGSPESLATVGDNAFSPSISRQGDHLAFMQLTLDANIWRVQGPMASPQQASLLISSTRWDHDAQFSADSKRIAFSSSRSGLLEIWVCDADGSNPVPLTQGYKASSPRWSSNGQYIAFDSRIESHADIYVISATGGYPRRLTTETSEEVRPSWSQDGRWVYFGSNRSGNWQVWKAPAEGGQAVQITKNGGREACELPDGKFVYYTKQAGAEGIWRVPVAGGEEIRIFDSGQQGHWGIFSQGICFVQQKQAAPWTIEFVSFATHRVTKVTTLDKEINKFGIKSLSVSADGRSMLFAYADRSNSDIILAENFR